MKNDLIEMQAPPKQKTVAKTPSAMVQGLCANARTQEVFFMQLPEVHNAELLLADVKALRESLQSNKKLKSIYFEKRPEYITLAPEVLAKLLSSLGQVGMINSLDLQNYPLTKIEIPALFAFLAKNLLLRELHVSSKFAADDFQHFAIQLFKFNRPFTVLELSCQITDEGCQALVPLISAGLVHKLMLPYNLISDTGVAALLQAANEYLQQNPHKPAIIFEFDQNHAITHAGKNLIQAYFIEQIRHLRYPREDNVSLNWLTAMTTAFQTRKNPTPLAYVAFEKCQMDPSHFDALSELLTTVPTKKIHIRGIPLECKGLINMLGTLSAKAKCYPHLTTLEFSRCSIGNNGLLTLLQTLDSLFPNVKTIDFHGNALTEECVRHCEAARKTRSDLIIRYDDFVPAASFQNGYPRPVVVARRSEPTKVPATETTSLLLKK